MLPQSSSPVIVARVGVLAVAAVLTSAALVDVGRSAAESSGLIAFARADGIYVMKGDGTGLRAVRRGGVASQPRELAWSRDGSRLLFVARDDRIWAIDADGSNLTRVAAGRSPSYSPDGHRVAFTKYGNRGYVWVVNADGSGAHRFVKAPVSFVWEVDWNPRRGGRLAFSTGGWVSELYVIGTDGRAARNLTARLLAPAVEPAWSPNGQRIAFASNLSRRTAEIYVIDAGGGAPLRLTHDAAFDGEPTWSPDGRRIAFVHSAGTGPICVNCPPAERGSSEIFLVNADGSGLTRITHNTIEERSPAWQPFASP